MVWLVVAAYLECMGIRWFCGGRPSGAIAGDGSRCFWERQGWGTQWHPGFLKVGVSKNGWFVHEKSSENGWFWDTPNFRKPPYDMSFKQQPQHVPTTCPRKTAKIAWLQVLVSDIFLNLGLSESRVSPTLMFNHHFSQFFVKRGHLGRYSRLHFQTHSNHTYHRLLVG